VPKDCCRVEELPDPENYDCNSASQDRSMKELHICQQPLMMYLLAVITSEKNISANFYAYSYPFNKISGKSKHKVILWQMYLEINISAFRRITSIKLSQKPRIPLRHP